MASNFPTGNNLGTDQVLLYDVKPWVDYGFGVANFGENVATINRPLWGLTHEIGQHQLFIMTHVDAMRKQPPSINTIMRIGKMCNRCYAVLNSRQKDYPDLRLEEGHASPAPLVWMIHPCPYFQSDVVRNKWLMEYNDLLMIFLTNTFQHSDNNLSLTVTAQLAQDIYKYIREIKIRMGVELLGLDAATVGADDFVFSEQHYVNYHPDAVTLNIEALDRPGPIVALPTEDSLKGMLDGIPANLIAPNLKKFPQGNIPGMEGVGGAELQDHEVAPGVPNGIGDPIV